MLGYVNQDQYQTCRDLAAMRQSVASQAVAASALAAARYSRLACRVRRTVDEPALRKRICLHSDLTAGAGPLPTEGGMGSGTFMSEVCADRCMCKSMHMCILTSTAI